MRPMQNVSQTSTDEKIRRYKDAVFVKLCCYMVSTAAIGLKMCKKLHNKMHKNENDDDACIETGVSISRMMHDDEEELQSGMEEVLL